MRRTLMPGEFVTKFAAAAPPVGKAYAIAATLWIEPMAGRRAFFNRLLAIVKQSRAKSRLGSARASPAVAVSAMRWRDFERLVSGAFRRRGFTVTGFGGSAPDGGVDLGLVKNGERFLVQCRHWRREQVGAPAVRELDGVIAAVGARGGFVVTGGQFTREARELSQKTRIELIDGCALEKLIGANVRWVDS